MQTATMEHNVIDPCEAWQVASGASWCKRLSATITPAVCETNQCYSTTSGGDLRCRGCGGLGNQTEFHAHCPIDERPVMDESADDHVAGLETLDDVIDSLYETPLPGDDFDDFEIDLDEDELLALFPELAGKEISEQRQFKEYQTEAPRRAVYHGKCKKCGGWMDNIREGRDDNTFRCLPCGWRTSDIYERNRAIHAAGGVIV